MQACVQGSDGSGCHENPGSDLGTSGCEVLGLHEYVTLRNTDSPDLGDFEAFVAFYDPLVQQFSGEV